MKKVLFISDYNFRIPGGAQKSMEIVMNGLSDKYKFFVLMPGEKIDNRDSHYTCICLEKFDTFLVNESFIKTIKITCAINRVINKIQPDLIHVHMVSSMSVVELLKKLIRIKCKLVYTERGVANQYSKITKVILMNTVKDFDKIITTTNINKRLYVDLYTHDAEKVTVIPNTAGPIFEGYKYELKLLNKKKYNLIKKTIMMNARLTYNKNWELSKRILFWMAQNFDFQYIIVIGSDRSEKDIQKCKIQLQQIEEIVGRDNFTGYYDLTLSELNELYYASDVFIMSSRSESFGRTAVEAMARGNVVFGTNIDGLAEVIGYSEYKYTTLDEFKDKFLSFQDKNLKTEQNKFYNKFIENYSLEKNLEAHKDIYGTLI
ncbi:glycosyltransferase family 4 protein [Sporolactobacillus kofuensis]|uniref:Glycosyltransferase family 4 protein n=1 Tax=Sporolactobacillus kofuensis TaxID=269672 RepID=A0ABW1WHZ5_9BACL|nr:glycosyltransferase family 4 protein [Sporolactobacillus kofuensis]MCO7177097.1 glycosyltransferase family 4 protein [Sporolactobacillus kofuensis]